MPHDLDVSAIVKDDLTAFEFNITPFQSNEPLAAFDPHIFARPFCVNWATFQPSQIVQIALFRDRPPRWLDVLDFLDRGDCDSFSQIFQWGVSAHSGIDDLPLVPIRVCRLIERYFYFVSIVPKGSFHLDLPCSKNIRLFH